MLDQVAKFWLKWCQGILHYICNGQLVKKDFSPLFNPSQEYMNLICSHKNTQRTLILMPLTPQTCVKMRSADDCWEKKILANWIFFSTFVSSFSDAKWWMFFTNQPKYVKWKYLMPETFFLNFSSCGRRRWWWFYFHLLDLMLIITLRKHNFLSVPLLNFRNLLKSLSSLVRLLHIH